MLDYKKFVIWNIKFQPLSWPKSKELDLVFTFTKIYSKPQKNLLGIGIFYPKV